MKLSRLGEDRLLAELLPRLRGSKLAVVDAGDDCAVLKLDRTTDCLVLKTDCIVERVHFLPGTNPVDVGWKAIMRPLSDFAAVSALPRFALITLIVSRNTDVGWVRKLYRGLNRAAERFNVGIIGGETSATHGPAVISVSVAAFVERERIVTRSGGKVGDDLFVTGRLGGAVRRRHLRFVPRIAEARWLTAHFSVHAMMDLSDGLGVDLPRLARASKTGFKIDRNALPLNRGCKIDNALSDGEDYELLFATSRRDRNRLEKTWRRKFPRIALTRIGSLTRNSKLENRKFARGYVHFQ